MLSSSCFRIPSPELSAAAVLETTINTAVYAQQYVRYTKIETIAAAAAAAAPPPPPPLLPLPLRSSAAGPCRARYCRSEAPQLALVELATLPRDCRRTPTDWSW